MLMVSVMVMRFGKLLEGMMHLMRCGIDQKIRKEAAESADTQRVISGWDR
jgi:hypothetical protein